MPLTIFVQYHDVGIIQYALYNVVGTSIFIQHQILTNVIKTMYVQRILHVSTKRGPMNVCVRKGTLEMEHSVKVYR